MSTQFALSSHKNEWKIIIIKQVDGHNSISTMCCYIWIDDTTMTVTITHSYFVEFLHLPNIFSMVRVKGFVLLWENDKHVPCFFFSHTPMFNHDRCFRLIHSNPISMFNHLPYIIYSGLVNLVLFSFVMDCRLHQRLVPQKHVGIHQR